VELSAAQLEARQAAPIAAELDAELAAQANFFVHQKN